MAFRLLDEPTARGFRLLDEEPEQQDAEFSALRSGAVEFLETAIGAGDELDAVARLLSGEADDYASAIAQSRRELEAFREDAPSAAAFATGAGLVGSLFIPGMGLAKISQAATKGQRALRGAGFGAAEGAAYGFLQGEGEEGRLEGAGLGLAGGVVLGGAAGRFLTKGADEIAQEQLARVDRPAYKSEATHIGGDKGFVNVGRTREQAREGLTVDTSVGARTVRDVVDKRDPRDFVKPDAESGALGSIFLGTREWFVKNVGERAARLAEDAEIMIRHDQREIDKIFDEQLKDVALMFDTQRNLKALTLRMNEKISEKRRVSWDDLSAAAKTDAEKDAMSLLEVQVKGLQDMDFVSQSVSDYFPTVAVKKIGSVIGEVDDYANPVIAIKQMAEDISSARALAARFDIDVKDLRQPKTKIGESRLNVVIEAIQSAAKKQGASEDVAANLANGLRSQIIASQKGGNAAGAAARRATSAALLGNPMNAILNLAEGVTAPIYQNGVKAWAKTVPKAVVTTMLTFFDELSTVPIFGKAIPAPKSDLKGWLSNKRLGLDRQFMGELANTGEKALNTAIESWAWTKVPDFAVRGLDALGAGLYKVSGVSTVNRMGQEILSNSAIQRGMDLAKKGDLDKLRKHDGMRGLTENEFQSTVAALKARDVSNPYLINFAGAALNKWQPVSAASMPKAFHDNPNGRMFYSMLSYMNRQMNNIRTEIGLKSMKAFEKGLNTKEGADAAKEAMIATAMYTGLFGAMAGMWDDARKSLDLSRDKYLEDLMTPEGFTSATMNQLASNISSGIINIRSEEFGGNIADIRPAPIEAASSIGGGLITSAARAATGEEDAAAPLLRATRTYVPGFANVDRVMRMTTGERLFEDYID